MPGSSGTDAKPSADSKQPSTSASPLRRWLGQVRGLWHAPAQGGQGVSEPQLRDLQRINRSVHESIRYSTVPTTGVVQDDYLQQGVGTCGDFCYLLALELSSCGHRVVPWTLSTAGRLSTHTVLEVDGVVTLDPSVGVAYPHSVLAMVDRPGLSASHTGDFEERFVGYVGERLFRNVSQLEARSFAIKQGERIESRADVAVIEGRFYKDSHLHLNDGDFRTVAGAAPGLVTVEFTFPSAHAVSYLSVVPHATGDAVPEVIQLTAFLGAESVGSVQHDGDYGAGAFGLWPPANLVADRLRLTFSQFRGTGQRLQIRGVVIQGAPVAPPAK